MKKQYKHNKKTAHTFNIGNLVWLQAKDIKIVTVAPYFLLFLVFFSLMLIATALHTWLLHGSHAEAMQSSCSTHSTSFASWITRYLVTCLIWMLAPAQHLSHQSHVTRWSVHSAFSISSGSFHFS
jgi:hypothetical protein